MKKSILVISVILAMAAFAMTSAMGYTIKDDKSPYPFSNKAESRPQFSISTGTPAHNLTNEQVVVKKEARFSFSSKKPAKFSIETGKPYQYTFKLGEVPPVVAEAEEVAPTAEPVVEPAVNETPEVVEVPVTYTISGVVYEDANENAARDANETGLAGWTLDLSGMTATTAEDGTYVFVNLTAGEYVLSLVVPPEYKPVAPVNVTLDSNKTIDFPVVRVFVVLPPANETAVATNVTENVTEMVPLNTSIPA
ncbi:MAG: SdrD B-like domain-containing protein [Methanothrix sp.]|uniref:SdrD B-like domain-containing protein n=1 Tax=Methanothrix sp. TaxID=90426 RepID=UPI00247B6022|nr:SdrD B-like domain-containing protein [Methanothrix sp.]